MPSVNWREMADNWFGACCCSFGGISEKLVNRYADAYTCTRGVCLLTSTAVTLCKDDLAGCKFADLDGIQRYETRKNFSGHNGLSKEGTVVFGSNPRRTAIHDSDSERLIDIDGTWKCSHLDSDNFAENLKCEVREEEPDANRSLCVQFASDVSENVASRLGCCHLTHGAEDYFETSTHEVHEPSLADQKITQATEAMANRRSFLNGFLGDVFMAKSYNLSVDIEWKQFVCFQCSTLLGAYPCVDGKCKLPIDDGVRLFKCYLSTSLPVGGSDDLFRKYNLEKMFANHLMESAKDELSFRTVVKDLTTRSPMLQVVLVNPNSWCCSDIISDSELSVESTSKLDLHPVIKLLFSDCSNKASQLRVLEDWLAKNLADEVFILPFLIEELIKTIRAKEELLPPSCTSFEGLSLSFMLR